MATIKLVIWDLDETLWKGTLSEGEVCCDNMHIIKELSEHGIINSISSKNNFEDAKAKLQEYGIWDYFVFPSINWNPKGEAVKQIIEDCQLRSPNVVFIDDNVGNIKEVEFYNPDIVTYNSVESFLASFDYSDYKEDKNLKRLKQYKLLEQKKEYRTSNCTSNQEFLEKSNIRIQFIDEIAPISERLVEMIGRTNQLNYTKVRIDESQLLTLLENKDIECRAIRVVDNFGDYGICGFYALDIKKNKLIHFLFSCRILNIGVENYVYQKLGSPLIDIVEPVTTKLQSYPVTWINEVKSIDVIEDKITDTRKITLALVGGCDLDQLCHYIDKNHFEIIKDFNYPNDKCIAVHREHILYQRKVNNISKDEFEELSTLPFLDEKFLDFNYMDNDYDYLVFSPLMNYSQEIYVHNTKGYKIAYGSYIDITTEAQVSGFSNEELASFKKCYCYIGQQSVEDFKDDLLWLLNTTTKPIIFLNGAETKHYNLKEIGALERHRAMNAVLDSFVKEHSDRCQIIDVRKYVTSKDNLKDNIRHYEREVYVELAKQLMLLTSGKHVSISKGVLIRRYLRDVLKTFYRKFLFKRFGSFNQFKSNFK